ncbi:MAG: isoprenyl transferase [Caldicoprobacterales bacterium]|jgi:undecaprenyl diphosphate synthase|nr:isoprenyl transferase [Clostridiales bacterium]
MNFLNRIRQRKTFKEHNKVTMDLIRSRPLPRHVSIIMDGNGRWAERKGLPRAAGHRQGVEKIREIIKASAELGIQYLTLYAFSTENWKRPKEEIKAIMSLLVEYLRRELDELHRNNIKIVTIGNIASLPEIAYEEIQKSINTTSANTGLQVNVALNYGGRLEIVTAIREISRKVANNELNISDIDEDLVSNHLYTGGIPDPDLLIRTGGDKRVSNFLLYQIAYTELWFSDATLYWPDFNVKHYLNAIYDFQNRQRRYGGVIEKGEN